MRCRIVQEADDNERAGGSTAKRETQTEPREPNASSASSRLEEDLPDLPSDQENCSVCSLNAQRSEGSILKVK